MKFSSHFSTQEEIDLEYDLESALDKPPYVEWFVNNSARARAELECKLGQRFGPTTDETVDIYPGRKPGASVVVFIHGGQRCLLSSAYMKLFDQPGKNHLTAITGFEDADGPLCKTLL